MHLSSPEVDIDTPSRFSYHTRSAEVGQNTSGCYRRGPILPPHSLVSIVETPALIYDQRVLGNLAGVARRVRERCGTKVLYAVKACAFSDVLEELAPSLDGFAVSSLFEARLVHDLQPGIPIHLTTPGLRDDEIDELAELCSVVTFNSESQLLRFGPRFGKHVSVGLRVNTGISNVEDPRYDPTKRYSKLGVPLRSLPDCLASSQISVCGLHFHTNADSVDLAELEANVEALVEAAIGVGRFDWVNFGGGYLFGNIAEFEPLERSVALAHRHLGAEVFVEPGAGLVRTAGTLICTVIDSFERDGSVVAVLDTSVNHLPEVFEFDFQPEVAGSTINGDFEYLLVGSSCLAGDVFGRYRLDSPLAIGTTVTLTEVGAYAQAKSDRFNGINLPSVWIRSPDGLLTKRQSLDYESYLKHWVPDVRLH